MAGLQVGSCFLVLFLFNVLFWLVGYIVPSLAYLKPPSCSTLSGNHGVPRVHYKGKQGEFYIMVMDHVVFILHIYSGTLLKTIQLYSCMWPSLVWGPTKFVCSNFQTCP